MILHFTFRTGEKMALTDQPGVSNDDLHCCMCHAPLDTANVNDCSAMTAIAFSQSVARRGAANQLPADTATANQMPDPKCCDSTNGISCDKNRKY